MNVSRRPGIGWPAAAAVRRLAAAGLCLAAAGLCLAAAGSRLAAAELRLAAAGLCLAAAGWLLVATGSTAVAWNDRGPNPVPRPRAAPKDRYQALIAQCDDRLLRNPTDVATLLRRGLLWQIKKDDRRAMADLDAAIRLAPNNGAAWSQRGSLWRSMGEV